MRMRYGLFFMINAFCIWLKMQVFLKEYAGWEMKGYYSKGELQKIGFKEIGEDVSISRKTSIYGAENMKIGSHVRIDDFCVFVGDITVGNYVHIGAFCGLHASKGGRIIFEDFSGVSANVQIYSSSDSFDGQFMTARPGIPEECLDGIYREVVLGKYSQIGTGSVVLPFGSLGEGAAAGAMSLVSSPLKPWGIYAGIPCRFIRGRSRELIERLKECRIIPFRRFE